MTERARIQGEWARLLLGSLADAGVRHVVISPGARSTPYVLAAVGEPRLILHDVIDERCAAFFALGQARATGHPSLLICTSGTAGANYFPAVVEAGASHTPLLVLTADRPVELVGCGSNQAIDQLKLFGGHAKAFFDLGLADDHPSALRGLRRIASQAVFTASWPEPGAVHLNARARKPLEPPRQSDDLDAPSDLQRQVDGLLAGPIAKGCRPVAAPAELDLDELIDACEGTEKGVIVAGPSPLSHAALVEAVAELSRRTGFPVLAEASSQLRRPAGKRLDAFDAIYRTPTGRKVLAPELVVQIGRVPISGAWGQALASRAGSFNHWVISPFGWNDAESTATAMLAADPAATLRRLLRRLENKERVSPWTGTWRRVSSAYRRVLDALLDGDDLSEAKLARAVSLSVPAGGLLALGNSLPIRLLDAFGKGPAAGVGVLSQRGVSGIDGLVSGAAGAAVATGRATLLYLGDVSLWHDLGGLATIPHDSPPFVVVVAQNQGGRIFEQLPVAHLPGVPEKTLDHWVTPNTRSFEHAAKGFNLKYRRIDKLDVLRRCLMEAFDIGGAWLIEAEVPPHEAAEVSSSLLASLERELARILS